MIKYRFLYFKTLTDFQDKLSEIDRQSIVFIQDKKLIWTHGQYYGEVPEAMTINVDSELSNLSINPVQNNVVKRAIDTLQALCEQTSDDVSYIKNAIDNDTEQTLQKFQQITDFLNSIQDTDDGASIIAGFSELVAQEESRAKAAEKQLSDDIQDIQDDIVDIKTTEQNVQTSIGNINRGIENINSRIDNIPLYNSASEENDGLMTIKHVTLLNGLLEDLSALQTAVASKADSQTVSDLEDDIADIQSIISDDSQIDDIIAKYNRLKELIEDIPDSSDALDVLTTNVQNAIASINELSESVESSISDIQGSIQQEQNRATSAETTINNTITQLTGRVSVLEKKPSDTTIHTEDGISHIFTTLEEYQALTSYQDNTIYFILEPEVKTNWTFGGTFPIVFTDGLGTFPITLT